MGKLYVGDHEIDLTLAIGPSSGAVPVQEVIFSGSVTITFDLESGSSVQLVTRANAPEASYISEMATDVWLTGEIQARFRTTAVWQEWFHNGQDNISMQAVTYKKLLNRRLFNAPLTFTDTDLGSIIWGMWQHTQALPGGNLGVTRGSPYLTGVLRTREYKVGENIGQQAENEYDEGIWWSVDHNRVYTAGLLAARAFIAAPIHLGSTAREMQRASGSDYSNVVYGDADESTTVGVWAVAPTVGTDPRGRWETAVGWPTVKLQETLNERTAAALEQTQQNIAHWNVEIEPSRWVSDCRIMPGDHAVLVVPRSLAAPLGEPTPLVAVRCTQLSINYDADGSFSTNIVVNEVPEIPLPTMMTDSRLSTDGYIT